MKAIAEAATLTKTNRPRFRIALTVALLWVLGTVGYGAVNRHFETYIWQKSAAAYDRECGVEAGQSPSLDQVTCAAARSIMASDLQRFMHGNPIWHAAKFALLPPLILILLCAYWDDLRDRVAAMWRRYVDWVKGPGTD